MGSELTVAHCERPVRDPRCDKTSGIPQRIVQPSEGASVGRKCGLKNVDWCTGDVDSEPETLSR